MKDTLRYFVAAGFVLSLAISAGTAWAQPPGGMAICHATSSATNPYNDLVLPPSALSTHLDSNGSPLAGHEQDFFPRDSDCDRSNDPGGPGGPPPAAIPEPITMLLFGTGLAGLGYASRRFFGKGKEDNDLDN